MDTLSAAPLPPSSRTRSRDGHRRFLAALLVFIGALHFMFSVWATWVFVGEENTALLKPGGVSLPFSDGASPMAGVIARFLAIQIWMGWILGPLSFVAAYGLVKSRWRGFVTYVAWINIPYFPTGTTVGILMLLALRRGVMDSPPVPAP